jgi:hypothetical protein
VITQIVLEELQIYRKAQMAILNPANTKSRMDLSVEAIDGDRSGHVHIGFNQSLYIGTGKLPFIFALVFCFKFSNNFIGSLETFPAYS